jgi:ectoine hydroxylase-related dioxygenase (phytanoyl-CoA dioxygenase family)
MAPTIERLDRTADAGQVADLLIRDGCVIVENLASSDEMDQFTADMKPWLKDRDLGHDEFSGFKTRRVSALVARSEVARRLALDPISLAVCDRLLLPNTPTYRLQVTHMVDIGPNEVRQGIHRDDAIYPPQFHLAMPDLITLVHGMWAVTDFTVENGATTIVPGSHLWCDRDRRPEAHEITQAAMPKGSVAFYLGSTMHGGGANVSNTRRTGALIGYGLGWLRQEENMYLTCPPEIAKAFPERLQRLVGYDMFGPHAGWVDDAHPLMTLRDDADFKELRVL